MTQKRFHATVDGPVAFTAAEEAEADLMEAKSVVDAADFASKEYQRLRASAYPDISEQLDMMYWDGVNGTTVWRDAIAGVKSMYQKS